MQKSKVVILIGLLFCFVTSLRSQYESRGESATPRQQILEAGLPYIQNYTPKEYNKANARNFGAVQDSLGILYFANGDGVMMYDGINWQIIELPKKTWASSIAIDQDNTIYVGGNGEFGFLKANPLGVLNYNSLSNELGDESPKFTWISKIHVLSNEIFFQDRKFLFRWSNDQINVYESDTILDNSFVVGPELYVNVQGNGLMQWDDNKLVPISGGDFFKNKKVRFMISRNNDKILIGTTNELFIYDKGKIQPFKTELNAYFIKNEIYDAIELSNGDIALATLNSGLAVIDRNGEHRLLINQENVLASLAMNHLFEDRSGLLWASLEYGISKIEYPTPFSTYNHLGASSTCFSITRFKDKLYAGMENGLYQLKHDSLTGGIFEKFMGINRKTSDLLAYDEILLAVINNELYQIKDDKIERIGDWQVTRLHRSRIDPSRVFISLQYGIGSIYFEDGNWVIEGRIDGVDDPIANIVEEGSGTLWLSGTDNQTYKISFGTHEKASWLESPKVERFGPEHGLPDSRSILIKVNDNIYAITTISNEAFVYDSKLNRFKADQELKIALGMSKKKLLFRGADELGNIFFAHREDYNPPKFYVGWNLGNGKFLSKNINADRVVMDIGSMFYLEPRDSVIWFGGANGIVRHEIGQNKINIKNDIPSQALVKKVVYNNDSLLSAGAYSSKKFEIPFKNNGFRFLFANPSFFREDLIAFQYILDGFDAKWSDWSRENQKDYTNIPEGDYTFRVRAKNILGQLSNEGTYDFTILPPWYRTWWAYLAYVLMGVLLIWAFSQWRSGQLRKKNLALEAVVAERTEEIRKKNKTLSYQTERLKELDTMKTRLFANISHEFRTPLTLIKGPVEKLEREQKTQISMPNIKMIRRNANRLLNLVNQLLDLSKLDSGKLSLNKAEGDLFKSIRAAASAFSSHAASRNMDYQITVPATLLWASFDRDKLEKILYNLLSNAFKFTEDEGRVLVQAEFRNGKLRLKVADTGTGIPSEKLPHIFDRFYQVDDSYTREKAGSGIGLALTKELVELMGGTLFVESEPGHGTEFRVVIPLEKIETTLASDPGYETLFLPEEVVENTTDKSDGQKNDSPVILIIEDNNDMRFFIREQLSADYVVEEAINGEQGFEIAEANLPDLIITDLMMPRVDGITLCKQLKMQRSTSHIPVIMLTAKAGIENKLEGLETGADDYLTKPFNARELQIRVGNLIEQRARLRALYSKNVSLDPKTIAVNSVDEEFLEEVLAMMEENYQDASFGPVQLQRALAMSKTQLHRKLKALTDAPPSELLRNFRLKRAAQLLPQREDNISQVAYDVGFNSLSYFTKCFKDLYGVSPSRYIKDQGTNS